MMQPEVSPLIRTDSLESIARHLTGWVWPEWR